MLLKGQNIPCDTSLVGGVRNERALAPSERKVARKAGYHGTVLIGAGSRVGRGWEGGWRHPDGVGRDWEVGGGEKGRRGRAQHQPHPGGAGRSIYSSPEAWPRVWQEQRLPTPAAARPQAGCAPGPEERGQNRAQPPSCLYLRLPRPLHSPAIASRLRPCSTVTESESDAWSPPLPAAPKACAGVRGAGLRTQAGWGWPGVRAPDRAQGPAPL